MGGISMDPGRVDTGGRVETSPEKAPPNQISNDADKLTAINNSYGLLSVSRGDLVKLLDQCDKILGDDQAVSGLKGVVKGDIEEFRSAVVDCLEKLKGGSSSEVKLSSMDDIMLMVSIALLTAAQDRKKAQSESRLMQKDIGAKALEVAHELGMESAKENYKASKLQAWAQIAKGAFDILGGAINIGVSGAAAKNNINAIKLETAAGKAAGGGSSAVSGNANTTSAGTDGGLKTTPESAMLRAKADELTSRARAFGELFPGFGNVAQGLLNLAAAGHKFEADKLNLAREEMNHFIQAMEADASANRSDIEDLKKFQDTVLQFLQKYYDMTHSTDNTIAANTK